MAPLIIRKWHTPLECWTVDESQLHVVIGLWHLQGQVGQLEGCNTGLCALCPDVPTIVALNMALHPV